MKNKGLYLILFLISYQSLFAQTKEFGLWTAVGIEKKLGKWDLSLNTDLRTNTNPTQLQRWSVELEGAYKVIKPLKIGVSYKYIYFYDEKYSDFQPRLRYSLFVQGKQKFGDFIFSLREQVQRTVKNENDRIKENGKYDNYKINPEWTWRNRLSVTYNIPKCPVTPSLSVETFYQLNNPDGNTFDKMRYELDFKYKLNKHNFFNVYGLIDQEINSDDPETLFVIGAKYTYSF